MSVPKKGSPMSELAKKVRSLEEMLQKEGHPAFRNFDARRRVWWSFMEPRGYVRPLHWTDEMGDVVGEYIIFLWCLIWKWRMTFDYLWDSESACDIAKSCGGGDFPIDTAGHCGIINHDEKNSPATVVSNG
jgi:hypothetical protein